MDGDVTSDVNRHEALGDESDIYVWKVCSALAGYHASDEEVSRLVEVYRGEQDEVETAGFESWRARVRVAEGVLVTQELAGYLHSLKHRFRERKGTMPAFWVVADHSTPTHEAGLAVDLVFQDAAMSAILREDWLFDRIYKNRLPGGHVHLCLNPRFGREFMRYFEAALK